MKSFARVYTPSCGRGVIRTSNVDFCVDEILGFPPDGEGNHILLHIEKKETNTDWLVQQLVRFVGVKAVDIGYAGKKDRHAHTKQWLSIHMSGVTEPDWEQFNTEQYRILAVHRHRRKLRPGCLQGNHFELVIRDLDVDWSLLDARLQKIKYSGVPNYFGEQRFGYNNLESAKKWLAGNKSKIKKTQQSIYISVLRSYMFNCILDYRVREKNWNRVLGGDVMMLSGSHSCFVAEDHDALLQQRLSEQDIAPTGPLCGLGESLVCGEAKALEQAVLIPYQGWIDALVVKKVKQRRRSLMLFLSDMVWQFEPDAACMKLSFTLPAGSYATVVLRELIEYKNAQRSVNAI
ncbi:tRNA pseudouridine(13) synthase [hydrothermal vent metagenome]|uniref:tRNA pseudouridine(13) synthase n=1 Tax=hydrothermal vent metagenome TaxID=652676 RepID=A0A3B0Z7T3_9ZZZZ